MGYDLYSAYESVVPPIEEALVKMDTQMALPSGCYGRVVPHSALAKKRFTDIGAGVTGEDYRGNVGVVLFHFDKKKLEYKKQIKLHSSFVNGFFKCRNRGSSNFG